MEGKRLFFDSVITSFLVSVIVANLIKIIIAYELKRSLIGFDFEWLIVFTAFAVCFFGLSVFAAPLYCDFLCFNQLFESEDDQRSDFPAIFSRCACIYADFRMSGAFSAAKSRNI